MKQNHTRVFFIETAFLTLFVLLALTVLVQVFGKARQLGEQAAHTSAAALILQNVDGVCRPDGAVRRRAELYHLL